MFSEQMKKMVKISVTRKNIKEKEGRYYDQPSRDTSSLDIDVHVHKSLEGDPGLTKLIKTAIKEIVE